MFIAIENGSFPARSEPMLSPDILN